MCIYVSIGIGLNTKINKKKLFFIKKLLFCEKQKDNLHAHVEEGLNFTMTIVI